MPQSDFVITETEFPNKQSNGSPWLSSILVNKTLNIKACLDVMFSKMKINFQGQVIFFGCLIIKKEISRKNNFPYLRTKLFS